MGLILEKDALQGEALKWLKNTRFYDSIDEIFDASLSKLLLEKEAQRGKPLMAEKERKR